MITTDMCLYENKLWFFAYMFNGLFYYDLEYKETVFVDSTPYDKINGEFLYESIIALNKNIILLPRKSHFITIYDTDAKKFITSYIGGIAYPYCVVNSKIYFFRAIDEQLEKSIYSVNCRGEVERICSLEKIIDENGWIANISFYDNTLWFCFVNSDNYYSYNLETKKIKKRKFKLSDGGKVHTLFCHEKGMFIIESTRPKALTTDYNGNEISEYFFDVEYKNPNSVYIKTYKIDDQIFVNYVLLGEPYVIKLNDNKIMADKVFEAKGYISVIGDKVLLLPEDEETRIYFSDETSVLFQFNVPDEIQDSLFNLNSKVIISERKEYGLVEFIHGLERK